VIETFRVSSDCQWLLYTLVTQRSVLWIANIQSQTVIRSIEEFVSAARESPTLSFSILHQKVVGDTLFGVTLLNQATYISIWRLSSSTQLSKVGLCLTTETVSSAFGNKGTTITALVATSQVVIAACQDHRLIVWKLPNVLPDRDENTKQLLKWTPVYSTSLSSNLTVNSISLIHTSSISRPSCRSLRRDLEQQVQAWKQPISFLPPPQSSSPQRIVFYLFMDGHVASVPVDEFHSYMVTLSIEEDSSNEYLDFVSNVSRQTYSSRIIFQTQAIARVVFFTNVYLHNSVFAHQSVDKLLHEMVETRHILATTKQEMEAYILSYKDTMDMQLNVFYRQEGDSECCTLALSPTLTTHEEQRNELIGIAISCHSQGKDVKTSASKVTTVGLPSTNLQLWQVVLSPSSGGSTTLDAAAITSQSTLALEYQRISQRIKQEHQTRELNLLETARQHIVDAMRQQLLVSCFTSEEETISQQAAVEASVLLTCMERLCWLEAAIDRQQLGEKDDAEELHVYTLLRHTHRSQEDGDNFRIQHIISTLERSLHYPSSTLAPWLQHILTELQLILASQHNDKTPHISSYRYWFDWIQLKSRAWRSRHLHIDSLYRLVVELMIQVHSTHVSCNSGVALSVCVHVVRIRHWMSMGSMISSLPAWIHAWQSSGCLICVM
jgi:hypothetical protein